MQDEAVVFSLPTKYQDTKQTVQKYRPSTIELANGGLWHPAIGSAINNQVCIGK
jgi:hypothetical protein